MASKKDTSLDINPQLLIQQFLESNKEKLDQEESYIEVAPAGNSGNGRLYPTLPLNYYIGDNASKIVDAKINGDIIKFGRNYRVLRDGEEPVRVKEDVRITRTLEGEEIDININGVKGFILYIETTPALKYYDSANNKFVNVCGVLGRNVSEDDVTYMRQPITKVFSAMTDFDSSIAKEYNVPHYALENLGMVGSRGEECVNCIRNKHNTTKNAEGNDVYCTPSSYVYMFVTSFYTTKKTGNGAETRYNLNKEYSVDAVNVVSGTDGTDLKMQLSDEGTAVDGTGFILKLEFSSMRLRGMANGAPPTLGLEGYLTNLQRIQSGNLCKPTLWETSIEARKVVNVNTMKESPHGIYHVEGGITVNPAYLAGESKERYAASDFISSRTLYDSPLVKAGRNLFKDIKDSSTFAPSFISQMDIEALYAQHHGAGSTAASKDAVEVDYDSDTTIVSSTQDAVSEDYFA
jgi:hypothetical protein